jgi:hypothetical protein
LHLEAERGEVQLLSQVFSRVYFEATHIGHIPENVQVPFLNEYVMIFTGTRQTFGELIAREDPSCFAEHGARLERASA